MPDESLAPLYDLKVRLRRFRWALEEVFGPVHQSPSRDDGLWSPEGRQTTGRENGGPE